MQETATDSWELSEQGTFGSGSLSVSSYVFQEQQSSSDIEQQNDNGAASSYSNSQQSSQVDSVYQTGTQSGGVYSNSSYVYMDSANSTLNNAAQGPGYSSSSTWTEQNSASLYANGYNNATSAATYTVQTSSGSGTYSNNGSTTPSNNAGAVVQFVVPDGNLVPSVSSSQTPASPLAVAIAGPQLSGSTSGSSFAGSDAPVPVSLSLQQLSDGNNWLSNTDMAATQDINPAMAQTSGSPSGNGSNPCPFPGITAIGWYFLTYATPESGATDQAIFDLLPLPSAGLTVGSFSVQAWNSMRPLFNLLDPYLGSEAKSIESSIQQALHIQLPPVQMGAAAYSGDPFLDWVDNMLYNGGAPLAAGSAPLYGMDGNSNAFAALEEAVGMSVQMLVSTASFVVNTGLEIVAFMNPCGWVAKGLAAYDLFGDISDMIENGVSVGNVVGAVLDVASIFGACFAADMLLLGEGGKIRADAIREGDQLWSRDEHDPDGPLVLKRVLRVFERTARIWHMRLPGQVLRTTLEHPFWVENRQSWLPVGELQVGDVVRTDSGELLPVEAIEDSGKWERVYNWEIEDYHTYFVSATEDGASIWAHNASCSEVGKAGEKGARGILRGLGHTIVGAIQNLSGHGIDLITRKGSQLFFWEVKASQIGRFNLSAAQAAGVNSFVLSRLNRAITGFRGWGGLKAGTRNLANDLLTEIRLGGGRVRGGIIFIPDAFSGAGSTVKILPWLP